ncbi:serine hydrolase [Lentisphaerota bacterium WC36G]|nr:serine hydrolase [Lentisphaerae bacterium WC36]
MKNIFSGKFLLFGLLIGAVVIGHIILVVPFILKSNAVDDDNKIEQVSANNSNTQSDVVGDLTQAKVNENKAAEVKTKVSTTEPQLSSTTSTGDLTTAPTTSRSKDLVIPGTEATPTASTSTTTKTDKKDFAKTSTNSMAESTKTAGKTDSKETKSQDRVVVRTVPLNPTYPTNKLQKRFKNTAPGMNFDYSLAVSNFAGSGAAKAGILVDLGSRKVLWAKNHNKSYGIASMSKMMTALLAMEKIANANNKTLNTVVNVSKSAAKFSAKQRGGIIWLDSRESFTVNNLLKAMMIKSANDVAYLVGEYFGGGDVNKFVEMMNKRSQELGFGHSHYVNPHGLTEYRNRKANFNKSSAEEQARLAELLLQYPEIVNITSTTSFKLPRKVGKNKYTLLANTNKLISQKKGVIGMKTGFTNAAGWCLTTVYHQGDTTLVGVVMGMPSSKGRNKFMKDLLDWGAKKVAKK